MVAVRDGQVCAAPLDERRNPRRWPRVQPVRRSQANSPLILVASVPIDQYGRRTADGSDRISRTHGPGQIGRRELEAFVRNDHRRYQAAGAASDAGEIDFDQRVACPDPRASRDQSPEAPPAQSDRLEPYMNQQLRT